MGRGIYLQCMQFLEIREPIVPSFPLQPKTCTQEQDFECPLLPRVHEHDVETCRNSEISEAVFDIEVKVVPVVIGLPEETMENNDENDEQNDNLENNIGEEELALRRNQLLMFGVILLGILAICLAVAMPSDLEMEYGDPVSPIPTTDQLNSESRLETSIPLFSSSTNFTNSTRKSFFRTPEDSVENIIMRSIAIRKAIEKFDGRDGSRDEQVESEDDKINQIVEAFISTSEFEDFIIDTEIADAIRRLKKLKGYKKRESTMFDDIFQEIEKHFLGDDPNEVRLIRRIEEELEKRAREVIQVRRKVPDSRPREASNDNPNDEKDSQQLEQSYR